MPASGITACVIALEYSARLEACLESLRSSVDVDLETLCVVVQAQEAPGDEVRGGVRYLMPGMNLGWPGACHFARQHASMPFLWLVQDDVEVHPQAAAAVRRHLNDDGLAASRPIVVDTAGQVPEGSCGSVLDDDGDVVQIVPPRPCAPEAFTVPADLSYLPSAGLMIRTRAWDAVGGFNPWLYPVQCNDIDLGLAMASAGLRFRLATDAQMRHGGKASTPSALGHFCTERNRALLSVMWFGASADDIPADLASPAIVRAACTYRARRETLTPSRLREIAGVCAADVLLCFARWQSRGFDRLLADYRATTEARDWWKSQADAFERIARGDPA